MQVVVHRLQAAVAIVVAMKYVGWGSATVCPSLQDMELRQSTETNLCQQHYRTAASMMIMTLMLIALACQWVRLSVESENATSQSSCITRRSGAMTVCQCYQRLTAPAWIGR